MDKTTDRRERHKTMGQYSGVSCSGKSNSRRNTMENETISRQKTNRHRNGASPYRESTNRRMVNVENGTRSRQKTLRQHRGISPRSSRNTMEANESRASGMGMIDARGDGNMDNQPNRMRSKTYVPRGSPYGCNRNEETTSDISKESKDRTGEREELAFLVHMARLITDRIFQIESRMCSEQGYNVRKRHSSHASDHTKKDSSKKYRDHSKRGNQNTHYKSTSQRHCSMQYESDQS